MKLNWIKALLAISGIFLLMVLPSALMTSTNNVVMESVMQQRKKVMVVAHRGASKYAPENTLSAINKAIEMGVDVIEMDIRQTKDGHFVLMHDAKVNRTTNGKGKVADMTLEQIRELDAGSWFGPEFEGQKVPTLQEALKAMRGKALPDIDFKSGEVEKALQILFQEGFLDYLSVSFYSANLADMVKAARLSKNVHVRPNCPGGINTLIRCRNDFQASMINMNSRDAETDYINAIHILKMRAFVNCLGADDNRGEMLKALVAKADYIQCDNLDILLPLAKAYNQGLLKFEHKSK